MTILAIDPNLADLEALSGCLKSVHPEADVKSYTDPLLAFQYAFNNAVEAAYATITMKRLDGFALFKMLWDVHPGISVYLVETDDSHRTDAMRLGMRGYLVKPVTPQAIQEEETAEEW